MPQFDVVIIGAGMSGLAAGIRAKMLGHENVAIVERHTIAGGLNSYYQRGKRQFDVGLHALTNFARLGEKNRPLLKICKQLRIPYDRLQLKEQRFSSIQFPFGEINFTNNKQDLITSVERLFPDEIRGLHGLIEYLSQFNETDLERPFISTRQELTHFFNNQNLIEMLLWPLLIYGSACEDDMDFGQFAIMFKAIYQEGFARPLGGVRTIIDLLLERFKMLGGEIFFKKEVKALHHDNQSCIQSLEFKDGETWQATMIFSSVGQNETWQLTKKNNALAPIGRMSFTEAIFVFDSLTAAQSPTIAFYSGHASAQYHRPEMLFDKESAVICFPNNYTDCEYKETVVRITHPANYDLWKNLSPQAYRKEKENVKEAGLALLSKNYGVDATRLLFHDVFTPLTVERYTGHQAGAVYGSPHKIKNGATPFSNLFLIGTDQGFLGVVGALLSGISMANLYLFKPTSHQMQVPNEL
ncbi:MAG: NAD(P)/FAD-dependent oxidoreductase [Bdellovibrio sp.]|nr:NAD(P)/FAD-dependent oxidoreductase [Bdellovibrio sp.]